MWSKFLNFVLIALLIGGGYLWHQEREDFKEQIQLRNQEIAKLQAPVKDPFGRSRLTAAQESEFRKFYEQPKRCINPASWRIQVECVDERNAKKAEFREKVLSK